jgi:hypothetical protein
MPLQKKWNVRANQNFAPLSKCSGIFLTIRPVSAQPNNDTLSRVSGASAPALPHPAEQHCFSPGVVLESLAPPLQFDVDRIIRIFWFNTPAIQ